MRVSYVFVFTYFLPNQSVLKHRTIKVYIYERKKIVFGLFYSNSKALVKLQGFDK